MPPPPLPPSPRAHPPLMAATALIPLGPPLTPAQEALFKAARRGDVDEVERALVEGANANAVGPAHDSLLMNAAFEGQEAVVELLLARGADVNWASPNGTTALTAAVVRGRLGVLRALLDGGARVRRVGGANPPLWAAVSAGGDPGIVHALMDAGADPGERGPGGSLTPAHLAASKEHLAPALEVLLRHGADAGARDDLGWTPLHYAAALGNMRCVALLLGAHANPTLAATNGDTPLHAAAYWGKLPAVKALLAEAPESVNGAPGGRLGGSDGAPPINKAAEGGRWDVVRVLLAGGARHGVADTRDGAAPLHWALAYRDAAAVRELINAGGAGPGLRADACAQCGSKGGATAVAPPSPTPATSAAVAPPSPAPAPSAVADSAAGGTSSGTGGGSGSSTTNSELFVCTACAAAYYCGVPCQRAHWKAGHKVACKAAKALTEKCSDRLRRAMRGPFEPPPPPPGATVLLPAQVTLLAAPLAHGDLGLPPQAPPAAPPSASE